MFETNKREKDFLKIALHSQRRLEKGEIIIQTYEDSKQRSLLFIKFVSKIVGERILDPIS